MNKKINVLSNTKSMSPIEYITRLVFKNLVEVRWEIGNEEKSIKTHLLLPCPYRFYTGIVNKPSAS